MSETLILHTKNLISKTKRRSENILKDEDRLNSLLDSVNHGNKFFNKLNDIYLDFFDYLDDLAATKAMADDDYLQIKEILDSLHDFNTSVSKFFALSLKVEALAIGCKSSLDDLRINVRTLREYLSDLEDNFFLEEIDTDMDNLISNLV
jgi:uncharacterized protein YoxC